MDKIAGFGINGSDCICSTRSFSIFDLMLNPEFVYNKCGKFWNEIIAAAFIFSSDFNFLHMLADFVRNILPLFAITQPLLR